MAASSSSAARVLSEAFSNAQPASASLFAEPKSGASENQTAALAVDVTSAVSELVTPCKPQHGEPPTAGLANHDDTPVTSQPVQSPGLQDLAWEDIEPRLSQSHPEEHATQPQNAAVEELASRHSGRELSLPEQEAADLCPQGPLPEQGQVSTSLQVTGASHSAASSDALAAQPSGFLPREASVWSVQAPGALSAEPSGCWDDIPDVAVSQEIMGCCALPAQEGNQQPLHQQPLQALPLTACVDLFGAQQDPEDAGPDFFAMPEDMDFELPPLDSPDQLAPHHTSASGDQPPACLMNGGSHVESAASADNHAQSNPRSSDVAGCTRTGSALGQGSFLTLLASEEVSLCCCLNV